MSEHSNEKTLQNLQPGDEIRCTVDSEPQAERKQKTIERLMRRDPSIAKGLRRAQELRRRRMHVYIRGNRSWHAREKAARIAIVKKGASWVMPYTPDLHADLKSIETYLSIEKA